MEYSEWNLLDACLERVLEQACKLRELVTCKNSCITGSVRACTLDVALFDGHASSTDHASSSAMAITLCYIRWFRSFLPNIHCLSLLDPSPLSKLSFNPHIFTLARRFISPRTGHCFLSGSHRHLCCIAISNCCGFAGCVLPSICVFRHRLHHGRASRAFWAVDNGVFG